MNSLLARTCNVALFFANDQAIFDKICLLLQSRLVLQGLVANLPLSLQDFFVLKMLSAYDMYNINSNALQYTFTMEANTMNSDQTAPMGAV